MPSATSRLALPYPVADDSVDVPRDFLALANKLDPNTPLFIQGTAATRPAAGVAGRFHYATDTGTLTYDTGSVWSLIGLPNSSTYLQGTAAARPAAGTAGRFYYATDTQALSYDTGTAWKPLTTPRTIEYGVKTVTFPAVGIGATGYYNVPHTLGVQPAGAIALPHPGAGDRLTGVPIEWLQALTTTNLQFGFRNESGVSVSAGTVTIGYVCWV